VGREKEITFALCKLMKIKYEKWTESLGQLVKSDYSSSSQVEGLIVTRLFLSNQACAACWLHFCCDLGPVGNKEPHGRSLTPPLPMWDGEATEKAKLVGYDKNSITKQRREKKTTPIISRKRTYSMQCSHCPMLSLILSSTNHHASGRSPLKYWAWHHIV